MSALVTGASAGFGAEICRQLVQKGCQVIGCARRVEKLEELKKELGDKFLPLQMDVAQLSSIDEALEKIPQEYKDIDLLVNNAGLALGLEGAWETQIEDWITMINTNIVGLTYLTRKILPHMVERKDGYIINIGSIAGTYPYPGGNVYGSTKAYVRQFSMNLRADLVGKHVRVTNVEPGLCGDTEFSNVRFKGDDEKASKVYEDAKYITPLDIANIVTWLYFNPKHVNVNSIEVMPTCQSFSALHVHREKE